MNLSTKLSTKRKEFFFMEHRVLRFQPLPLRELVTESDPSRLFWAVASELTTVPNRGDGRQNRLEECES